VGESRSFKVLVVAWPCVHFGGAERWWYYVLKELKTTNIQIHVLIPAVLKLGCFLCPEGLLNVSRGIIYMPLHKNIILRFLSWVRFLVKIIKRRNVDFVIAGYQTPVIALAVFVSSVITKRKCFIVFHMPLGWLPYYINERPKLNAKNKLLIAIFKTLNKSCSFLTVSPSVIYDLRRINLNPINVRILNGAAVERPDKIFPRSYEAKDIDIVYLASISKHKGVLDVLEVVRVVKESIPSIKAVIIGRLKEDLRKRIVASIKSYGLEDNVELLGYVDEHKKFELLSRSKVMIYPSYMDTFAISVLEALTMGTPVVAYSIPAIMINYKTKAVIKVPTGNIQEMGRAVVELLTSESKSYSLSEEAMKFAEGFTWRRVASSMLKAIMSG